MTGQLTVEEWAPQLAAALGLDGEVDIDEVLAVAGTVAHAVERKAAPVSTYLLGLAAGRAGGRPEDVAAAVRTVRALAAERDAAGGQPDRG